MPTCCGSTSNEMWQTSTPCTGSPQLQRWGNPLLHLPLLIELCPRAEVGRPRACLKQFCDPVRRKSGPVHQCFIPSQSVTNHVNCFVDWDTLVNREDMSKLTSISSSSTLSPAITSTKYLEFLTCESVLPAREDVREVMCLELVERGPNAWDNGPERDLSLVDLREAIDSGRHWETHVTVNAVKVKVPV